MLKGDATDAGRNLVLGVVCALALAPLAGIAFWSAPKEAFVALSTAILLGLLFFLGMQFRLFVQRNGVFFVMMAGLLLAVVVPILVRLATTGSEWVQTFAEFKRQHAEPGLRSQPVPLSQGQPNANPSAPSSNVSQTKSDAGSPSSAGPDSVSQTQQVSGGMAQENPRQKASPVEEGAVKQKSAQAGTAAAPPADPDEDPVQRATRQAKDEAIRRYPALQSTGTAEHKMYLEAYNELARSRKFDFFKDPQWPLKLAEIVALREGWKSLDVSSAAKLQSPVAPRSVLPGFEFSLDNNGSAQPGVAGQGGGQKAALSSSEPLQASNEAPAPPAPPASGGSASAALESGPLSPEDEAVNRAMAEARRRYPAVAREGSPENRLFVEAYQELDSRRTDFFDRPDWPVRLVELVAKQEGWKRSGPAGSSDKAPSENSPNNKEMPLPQ